jgi:hypothetical protein
MRTALAVACLLIACGGGDNPSDPLAPPAPGQGLQYGMVSTIDAGQEIERCKLFVAPPEGLNINRESVRYTAGSHHVLLYLTSYMSFPDTDKHGNPIMPEQVVDCPDGAPADFQITSVVAGAQSANAPDIVDLPSDTALKVPGGAVLVMNTHYLNATPNAETTDARINIYTIPTDQVKKEAGIIFFYDPIIRVPPLATAQARMACPVQREYTVYNLQTHMHKRGIGGLANLTDGAGNVIRSLYQSDSWENVNVQKYDDLTIEAGQYLDYRCNYVNNEDRDVLQGLTTKDEMCMLVGAYAPRNALFEYCSPDGTSGAKGLAATFYGNGSATCMQSVSCLENQLRAGKKVEDESVWECILDSCEKSAWPFNVAVRCEIQAFEDQCKTNCADKMSTACSDCLHSTCATEMSGCQAASCS